MLLRFPYHHIRKRKILARLDIRILDPKNFFLSHPEFVIFVCTSISEGSLDWNFPREQAERRTTTVPARRRITADRTTSRTRR